MSSKQSFIYDGDGKGFVNNPFNVDKPVLLNSAGLEECVAVYMAVGDCPDCRPSDILWQPVYSCPGVPMQLCPDNPQVAIMIPGKYALGDPNDPSFTIAGDVNITMQKGVDPSLLGKCCEPPLADPLPVQIESSCEEPVFVQMCPENAIQVETAMAELGCIVDELGSVIGKVILCKMIDESTGVETVTQTAYFEDGSVEQNYTGAWQVCTPDVCRPEPFLGVITDLSVLQN